MGFFELLCCVLMCTGILWFYYDLSQRYFNLKSRVDLLESVLEVMQEEDIDK